MASGVTERGVKGWVGGGGGGVVVARRRRWMRRRRRIGGSGVRVGGVGCTVCPPRETRGAAPLAWQRPLPPPPRRQKWL